MPFIAQNRREVIDDGGLDALLDEGWSIEVGDRCYVFYKEMVDKWNIYPRWTTAHEIYRQVMSYREIPYDALTQGDDRAARELAWQVFFQLHVMRYEKKKRLENGDI